MKKSVLLLTTVTATSLLAGCVERRVVYVRQPTPPPPPPVVAAPPTRTLPRVTERGDFRQVLDYGLANAGPLCYAQSISTALRSPITHF